MNNFSQEQLSYAIGRYCQKQVINSKNGLFVFSYLIHCGVFTYTLVWTDYSANCMRIKEAKMALNRFRCYDILWSV